MLKMVATVLMVAEKPSLAASIANILSDRKSQSRKGFNGACSVNEWSGNFMGFNVKYKMTSVCGHVMSLDFPSKFNNWDRVGKFLLNYLSNSGHICPKVFTKISPFPLKILP